jgi:hypothetical protein
MSIIPSEIAKQKAQEILELLRGVRVVDVQDAIEMVQFRISEFSGHQAFGPLSREPEGVSV